MEKRSRDIQFSKVGIEVSRDDQQWDKSFPDISRHENHLGSLDISPQRQLSAKVDVDHPYIVEREVSCGLDSFQDLDNGTVGSNQGESLSSLPDEVENICTVMLEDGKDLSSTTCTDGGFKRTEIVVCYVSFVVYVELTCSIICIALFLVSS